MSLRRPCRQNGSSLAPRPQVGGAVEQDRAGGLEIGIGGERLSALEGQHDPTTIEPRKGLQDVFNGAAVSAPKACLCADGFNETVKVAKVKCYLGRNSVEGMAH